VAYRLVICSIFAAADRVSFAPATYQLLISGGAVHVMRRRHCGSSELIESETNSWTKAETQPRVENWQRPARYIQMSYYMYFCFMPNSLSFCMLQKSMIILKAPMELRGAPLALFAFRPTTTFYASLNSLCHVIIEYL